MAKKKKAKSEDLEILTDEEFNKLIFELESCEEAAGIIPDMYQCPVCQERVNKDGVLIHKDPNLYKGN